MNMKIGNKVAYSVQFLKSIGMSHGEMAHARGEVVELIKLGSITLAKIKWLNGADMPEKVNIANLAIVGANSKFCNCG